jgi:ABC-2 type transport system permease protein
MFAPGSALWLLRHELRLHWRSGASTPSVIFVVIALLLLHLIALAIAVATSSPGARALPHGVALLGLTMAMGFALLLMTSRALTAAIQSLYTRGDLDLLLSSPVSPGSIVAVRAAAIATGVTLELAFLLWPFANVFVLFGRTAWVKAYVLLPAFGMLATSVALWLMICLFRLLGPHRTRVAVQIAAAVIGTSFALLSMLPSVMNRSRGGPPGSGIRNFTKAEAMTSPIWWPAEQIMSGLAPTLLLALAGATALVLTVRSVSPRFVGAATLLASVSRGRKRRARSRPLHFRAGLRSILIAKELRLIARDPWLLTQLLQHLVYLVPLALVILRQQGTAGGTPWAWLAVVFVVGGTASSFAWLTVSAEDAPELLRASPVSTASVIRAKVEAALLPVSPLLLLPIVFLAASHPWFATCLVTCAAACGISCALLHIRNPVTRKRADFKKRHKGSALSGIIEVLVISLWVLVCAGMTWLGGRFFG